MIDRIKYWLGFVVGLSIGLTWIVEIKLRRAIRRMR